MESLKIKLKYILLLTVFIISGMINSGKAQEEAYIINYDVIYMKDGSILKGEILVFEEKDGDITFRDTEGHKYSITREEYKYFVEDIRAVVNANDTLVIRPRKSEEFEIGLGFRANYINITDDLVADEYWLDSPDQYNVNAVNLVLCAGKYLDRQNFIGASAEIGLLSEAKSVFGFGLRYSHQYDAYKKNAAFYVPVEIHYNALSFKNFYVVEDNYIHGITGQEVENSTDLEVRHEVSGISLNVGQGVSFIMSDKKSFSVEFLLFKYFGVNNSYPDLSEDGPNSDFIISGAKLGLLYNF